MTARDDLNGCLKWAIPGDHRQAQRDAYIDAYAHELAEKIRADLARAITNDPDVCTCGDHYADLIDPEVDK